MGLGLIILSLTLQSTYQETQERKIISNNKLTGKQLPNIYHLHLDTMQTDYFLRYLDSSDVEKQFDGFTLYEKNIANLNPFVVVNPEFCKSW